MMYLNDWKESGRSGLLEAFNDYNKNLDFLEGFEVLLASYENECYEGTAYVLLRKDGKLYEVHASHCSCYGLEGQWSPEETTPESIIHRLDNGDLGRSYGGDNYFAKELREVLSKVASLS